MKRSSVATWVLCALLSAACAAGQRGPRSSPEASAPSAEHLFVQGLDAHRQGDSTRAEQYLAAAMERGYPEQEALPVLVAACLQGERYDTALYYARAHLKRHPADAQLRYLVASLHFAVGQDDKARLALEQLLVQAPGMARAHYLLGVLAFERLRDARLARRAFESYLALAPSGEHSAEVRALLRRALAEKRR